MKGSQRRSIGAGVATLTRVRLPTRGERERHGLFAASMRASAAQPWRPSAIAASVATFEPASGSLRP